jgi:hypothetical protein
VEESKVLEIAGYELKAFSAAGAAKFAAEVAGECAADATANPDNAGADAAIAEAMAGAAAGDRNTAIAAYGAARAVKKTMRDGGLG